MYFSLCSAVGLLSLCLSFSLEARARVWVSGYGALPLTRLCAALAALHSFTPAPPPLPPPPPHPPSPPPTPAAQPYWLTPNPPSSAWGKRTTLSWVRQCGRLVLARGRSRETVQPLKGYSAGMACRPTGCPFQGYHCLLPSGASGLTHKRQVQAPATLGAFSR